MRKIGFAIGLIFCSAFVSAQSQAWDVLRPLSNFAVQIDFPIKLLVFLLASAVFVISLLAYKKSKSKRLLLVSIAFFLFSLKWLIKLVDLIYSPGYFLSDASENIFELGILLSLLVALFYNKRTKKLVLQK